VALAGVFAERSGIINLALEGIMIFGAFIGVLFVRQMQGLEVFNAAKAAGDWGTLQGLVLLAMLVSAAMGALFSLLLSFASINLRADQTIGGTALNLLAPALVLFFIRIIANQNTLNMASGDSASWFMIKRAMLGIDKSVDLGFFGETFINKVYLATYVCILVFIILSILLYKTRFGLRLRACGENPQAADSLGINVYKMRYAGTTISGALAGMGGFVYALTTANCSSNGDVAGFGFLALAVMIFGNWKPRSICKMERTCRMPGRCVTKPLLGSAAALVVGDALGLGGAGALGRKGEHDDRDEVRQHLIEVRADADLREQIHAVAVDVEAGVGPGSGGFSRFGRSGLTIHTFLLKSHKQNVHFL